jgi:hypothetical protein
VLLFLSLLFLLVPMPATPSSTSRAAAAFEKLKALEGDWDSYSTKGWSGDMSLRVIARGSAIVATSHFEEAHPAETMLSVFHLDSDRLLLTHYCVARNQPRLEAMGFGPDLATITFTFRDGTNLASRDAGHMDKAVFRLETPDRYTSRWTWYEKGRQRWMEEIRYERHHNPGAGGATPE